MLYTKHTTLTDTTLTTLFTVPSGFHAIVNYVFVANHGGSAQTIDLYWDLSGTPQVYIFDGKSLTGGSQTTLGNGGGPMFVLHENEAVKCQAGGAGNIEVVVTVDLLPAPASLVNFNGA
jgi:hypothetical protein